MRQFLTLALVSLTAIVGMPPQARAASLYFNRTPIKASSERVCYTFAADTARLEGFQNVHKNALEVAGTKDGAYVSITCVGRGNQPALAIVMSVADSFDIARRVADSAANRIKGIVCFDSCQ